MLTAEYMACEHRQHIVELVSIDPIQSLEAKAGNRTEREEDVRPSQRSGGWVSRGWWKVVWELARSREGQVRMPCIFSAVFYRVMSASTVGTLEWWAFVRMAVFRVVYRQRYLLEIYIPWDGQPLAAG